MQKSKPGEIGFTTRLLIFLIILLWCSGIFYEYFMPGSKYLMIAYPFVKKSYSLVCHQQPDKLIAAEGHHTLVCARCTGIYLGALLSSLASFFFLFRKKLKIKYLLYAALPMLADVLIHNLGLMPYNKNVVFGTGLLLGSAGFFYFYNGLKTIINKED